MNNQKDPLATDFRNFLYVVWRHLNLPDPTPVQYDIARYMQHGPRRKMIMAFRGVGKSWIYAAFVCWRLYCDPQYKIMVVSASKPLADSFSTFVKRLIYEMPILQHLQPRDGQRDSNIAFDVGPAQASKDPSVKSVGITGQITGSRADEILADDVESLNNSATQQQREKLAEIIKEFDAVLKPGGVITYLGTPQTEDSIYNHLPERGYEICVWPARVPTSVEKYKGRLATFIVGMIDKGVKPGTPVDPKRFNNMDLMEREASYGRSGFAMQFMLDTELGDTERYPLKLSDLVVMPIDKDVGPSKVVWASEPDRMYESLPLVGMTGDRWYRPMWVSDTMTEFTGCVMSIDPSGRGKDETGFAIAKMLHSQIFVPAAGGLKGGYEDSVLEHLAILAREHKAKRIIIEANFGDGMFTKLFTPWLAKVGYPCTIEEVKHSTQKEKRIIDTLEPVMNQHRLIIDPKVVAEDEKTSQEDKRYSLFYQMTRITKDKGALAHDDRLDALSMAVAYWVEAMARDVDKAAQDHRAKMLEAELKKMVNHAMGVKEDLGPRWFTLP